MLKTSKYGILNGIAGETRMVMNVMEVTSLAGSARQISAMRRLQAEPQWTLTGNWL